MMTDPIADFLSRIRNAQASKHMSVLSPMSKYKLGIAKVLKKEGYIKDFAVIEESSFSNINVDLKYFKNGYSCIKQLLRVSKPGRRIYSSKLLPPYKNGMGISILTTSIGVISDREAKKAGVGGEIICKVF